MITSEDINRVVKGPADLEERIEQLMKQKEILKSACKKAGARIEELERDREIFKKELDRVSEENDNLRIMMKRTGAPVER
jgi:chromosome segregation ATPase